LDKSWKIWHVTEEPSLVSLRTEGASRPSSKVFIQSENIKNFKKQALYGHLSKPTRIGHSIRHRVQKLLPDGKSQLPNCLLYKAETAVLLTGGRRQSSAQA
jgi:hypothetical protein